MRLTYATPKAIDYACKHFHYAKAVPVNPIGYNVYNDADEWCGVILYALGANKSIGTAYGLKQGQAMELVRVALNGKQSCTSQAIAMSLKQLHKDCPLCRLVVSYADCDQDHLGTIYQATNWIYEGVMNEGDIAAFIVNGRKTHKKSIYSRRVGGVCTARKHWMQSANTSIQMQRFSAPKANANTSCRWTRKCESRLNHCESRTRRMMQTGTRLIENNSNTRS